jgi:hypothetical protein
VASCPPLTLVRSQPGWEVSYRVRRPRRISHVVKDARAPVVLDTTRSKDLYVSPAISGRIQSLGWCVLVSFTVVYCWSLLVCCLLVATVDFSRCLGP